MLNLYGKIVFGTLSFLLVLPIIISQKPLDKLISAIMFTLTTIALISNW